MSAIDVFIGIILLFCVTLAVLLAGYAYDVLNTGTAALFAGDAQAQAAMAVTGTTVNIFDSVLIIFFLTIMVGSIISSFFIQSHPIFFIAMVLVNVCLIIIGAPLSNSFNSVATASPGISLAANHFPMAVTLMQNLPLMAVISIIVSAVFAAKIHSGGNR